MVQLYIYIIGPLPGLRFGPIWTSAFGPQNWTSESSNILGVSQGSSNPMTTTSEEMAARQQEVMRALEQAIAQTQEEIRYLEALLAVKREAERLQAGESEPES